MSRPRRRSLSGLAAISDSNSPIASACRPRAMSASMRSSSAVRRSSSMRPISDCAHSSYSTSANGLPRQRSSAVRRVTDAPGGSLMTGDSTESRELSRVGVGAGGGTRICVSRSRRVRARRQTARRIPARPSEHWPAADRSRGRRSIGRSIRPRPRGATEVRGARAAGQTQETPPDRPPRPRAARGFGTSCV